MGKKLLMAESRGGKTVDGDEKWGLKISLRSLWSTWDVGRADN